MRKDLRYSYQAMKLHLRIPEYLYPSTTLRLRYLLNYQISTHLLHEKDYLLQADTISVETFAHQLLPMFLPHSPTSTCLSLSDLRTSVLVNKAVEVN